MNMPFSQELITAAVQKQTRFEELSGREQTVKRKQQCDTVTLCSTAVCLYLKICTLFWSPHLRKGVTHGTVKRRPREQLAPEEREHQARFLRPQNKGLKRDQTGVSTAHSASLEMIPT